MAQRELELKLELDPAGFDRVREIAEARLGKGSRRRMRATYFDTCDHALDRAGISLRVRDGGDGLVQTLKIGGGPAAGVSSRAESEWPVEEREPDLDLAAPALRGRLDHVLAGRALMPVFEIETDRRLYPLAADGTRAELCLDFCRIRIGDTDRLLCEAEIELKAGKPAGIVAPAEMLLADTPVRFSGQSKAGRAFHMLRNGQASPGFHAVEPEPRIDPHAGLAGGFSGIATVLVAAFAENWRGFLASDNPAFAHDLRITIRQLRTALKCFRPQFDSPQLRELQAQLKRVADIVGEVRDADVLLADLVRPAADAVGADARTVERIGGILAARSDRLRSAARARLGSACWNGLLLRLALLPHGYGWPKKPPAMRIRKKAATVLNDFWRQVEKRGSRLDSLTPEQRHRLRKDLKTLRYAVEFFEPVLKRSAFGRFRRKARKLHALFGTLNDIRLVSELPGLVQPLAGPERDIDLLAGTVVGWHLGRSQALLSQAGAAWDRLARRAGFWR